MLHTRDQGASLPRSWSLQDLERCFVQERPFLLRLARSQLRDDQSADDVVQETAIAAWQGLDRFEGRASLRTWLVSILRFKILDSLRLRQRQPRPLAAYEIDNEMAHLVSDELLFNAQGQWAEMPLDWTEDEAVTDSPEDQLQQKQMLKILLVCLNKVPEKSAQVFLMREYMGFDGEEITQKTGLQAGHVRVILSRVRLTLRTCMDTQVTAS